MLDELEKTHAGQFERYKMYPLLKKKMAKKKGLFYKGEFMLSSDRQSNWLHLIVEGLLNKGLVHYPDKDKVIRATQRALSLFIQEHEQIEQKVRQKIASLKRNVSENSSEWEVLYSRYYEEEFSRSHLRKA